MRFFKTMSLVMFGLCLNTNAQGTYPGQLTCATLPNILATIDGNIQGFCAQAQTLCLAKETLLNLPPQDALAKEITEDLNKNLNFHLSLCALGIFKYSPETYRDRFSH